MPEKPTTADLSNRRQPQKLAFSAGLRQSCEQFDHTETKYFISLSTGGNSQRDRRIAFAGVAETDQENILTAFVLPAFCQRQQQRFVDARTGLEAGRLKFLLRGELGGLQSSPGRFMVG